MGSCLEVSDLCYTENPNNMDHLRTSSTTTGIQGKHRGGKGTRKRSMKMHVCVDGESEAHGFKCFSEAQLCTIP